MVQRTQWLRRATVLLALLAPMAASRAQSTANIVQENFTGDTVENSWIAVGGACLTAGDSNTKITSSGYGIPACIGLPYYLAGGNPTNSSAQTPFVGLPSSGTAADAVGSGALRLTNGGTQSDNEVGAIISPTPFASNQGIQVTFTTYTYGGNQYGSNGQSPGADGIGFYLIDASKFSQSAFTSTNLGAFGGSLGYSCSQGKNPANGITGGYIGLGIDEYGNYFNYNDNTATGQTVVTANEGTQNPGEIGLRGAGNVNWTGLNAAYPTYYPSTLNGTQQLAAVQNTCASNTLWNYSTPSNPQQVLVKTTTPYACSTQFTTTYSALHTYNSTDYPTSGNNAPNSTQQTQGVTDTCNSGQLYKWSSGSQKWVEQSGSSNSYTCATQFTTTYAQLTAVNSTYYPASLSASLQTQAVSNTCSAGYLYNNTPINDYDVIPGSVVTLPTANPISSEESSSGNNVAATRAKATPITYQLILTSTGLLSFSYDYGKQTFNASDSTTVQVLNQQSITSNNGAIPSYFLFGFGASTGGGTNVHEITCFEASPAARTIGAPVAPLTVSSGSLLYTLTSNPSPVQGYVDAYSLDSSGNPSSTASWEAGSKMTDTQRAAGLYSTASDGSTVALLSALDTGAFDLTATTCVPNTTTIVKYTIDPNTYYSPTPTGCTAPYLGTRVVGTSTSVMLDEFSPGDDAVLLTAPNDATLLTQSGYTTYAQKYVNRKSALLFTNDDGFLYSVDASTGLMNWGWMPRSFVASLQNYGSFPYADNFNGKFTVADAYNTASPGTWGTYVIGSANYGALWYDLKVTDATSGTDVPAPSQVVATFGPYQSTMPANTTALPNVNGTVTFPQRQAPEVATVNGSQYAAFLVNATNTTGSGSTAVTTTTTYLYEFNIATGVSTNAQIPATTAGVGTGNYVTSNLYYDSDSDVLYFGTHNGNVYSMSFTGSASTDVANIGSLGTTEDQQPVLYVGYQTYDNQPYLWAASNSVITLFGVNNVGWSPLWASGPGVAYTYGTSSWSPATSSSSVTTLQSGATISDLPLVVNGVLVVPVYVPPSAEAQACNILGEGYYDFFTLSSGAFPQNTVSQNGTYLTADLALGQGKAYSPSISISGTALPLYGSTQQAQSPQSPLLFSRSAQNTIVQWRVH